MNKLLLFLTLVAVGALQARPLPPHETATLRTHMLEVNAEWSHMAPDAAWLDNEIAFVDEKARIQTHLNLVVNTLKQRNVSGFSTEASTQRDQLLLELQAYAQRGLFPKNIFHSERIPYFIDHEGTACAVGFLMIQSGAADVAARVRDEMNQAYLSEIPFGELPTWAQSHGFTHNELAWIQPGYPPQTNYQSLGNGVDGTVTALAVDPNDNSLILAGTFVDASGVTCNGIARWNGKAYEALGDGLDGTIHAIAFHNGTLYAGGTFGSPPITNPNIASWDGQSWQVKSVSSAGNVLTLLSHNGTLYCGTEFGLLARLKNGNWEEAAPIFNGAIQTIVSYNGDIIAGGAFTRTSGGYMPHIASFSDSANTWKKLGGTEMDNIVHTLHVHKGKLYAGGELYSYRKDKTMGFAKYGTEGWEMVLDTANDANALTMYHWNNQTTEPAPTVRSLHTHQGGLFIGGEFMIAGALIGTSGSGLGWVPDNGSQTLAPVLWLHGDTVMALASYNNSLIVAGSFPYWGQPQGGNIFTTNLQGLQGFVGIDKSLPSLDLKIGPQPWTREATISGLPTQGYELSLFDLQGKEIPLRYTTSGTEATLYRDRQSNGMYMLHVSQHGRNLGAAKLLLQ